MLFLLGTYFQSLGQTTIFSENMGTPSGNTAIASNTFQNASLTFSGTADVRTSTPSSVYTGSSAGGNVFFTNVIGRDFIISGINTSLYTNLSLQFGHHKNLTTANNELVVEVSSDGSNYTSLSYSRPTGSGTATWLLISPTGSIPSTANLRIRFRQTSSVSNNFFRVDDVILTGTLAASPTITLNNNTQITAGNANQSELNHLLSRFSVNVATATATLNQLSFVAAGNFEAGDITNFELYTSATNTFPGGTPLSTVSAGAIANGGTVTFSSLSQACAIGDRFFWIAADVSATAGAGRTVSVPSLGASNFTFAAGTPTGTIDAGGAQTFVAAAPEMVLSSPNPAIAAGTFNQNSTNNVVYRFDMAVSVANTALTAFNITTTGNYAANAVSNLKAWYSTDATFNAGSDVLLATIAAPGTAGVKSFSGFNQALTSGNSHFIFVTVDVSCNAANGATLGVDAIETTDITTTASKTGSSSASGTHTVTLASPQNVTGLASTISSRSAQISWTNPTGCFDELLVVVQPVFSTMMSPSGDGSAYTADLNFTGSGSSFDANGGKVVYKGSTSPITVTGLTNGTLYYARFFTRTGTSWSAGIAERLDVDSFITVNFDDAAKWTQGSVAFGSYSNHSYTDGNVSVAGTNVIRNTTTAQDGFVGAFGTYSWRLRDVAGSKIVITFATGGVRALKFDARRWDGTPSPDVDVNYSTDGGTTWNNYTTIDNSALDNSSNWVTFDLSGNIYKPYDNIQLEIVSNSAGERIMIDNLVYSQFPYKETTWNGSSWSNSFPNDEYNATIDGNLTLNSPVEAHNVTVTSGNTLTIPMFYALTTTGNLVNNGTIILTADNEEGHGDLIVAGTITGNNISIEREITGSTQGWRFISSPVSGTLANLGSSVVLTGSANVIRLNTNNPNAWVAQSGAAGNALTAGTGYASYYGSAGVNGSAVATTLTLTGTVNNSNVTVTGLSNGDATGNFGWSLVGNPFTASLDFDSDHAAITMTNLEPAYYIWDAVAGNYGTWHRTSGSTPSNKHNGLVPMGQGFLVKANASSPVLTFTTSARSTSAGQLQEPAGGDMANVPTTTSASLARSITEKLYLKVEHATDGRSDEALVLSSSNATNQFESDFDAFKAGTMSTTAYSISTFSADQKNLSINGIGAFDGTYAVPVRITGSQPGALRLTANLSMVDPGTPVFIEDTYLNVFHDLRASAYLYTHVPAQIDRFVIHFASLATSVKANSLDAVQVYTFEGKLYIRGMEQAEQLRIVDMTGRVVYQNNAVQLSAEGLQPQLAAGTYLVQLVGKQGVKTAKVQF